MADFPSPEQLVDTMLESPEFDDTVTLMGEFTSMIETRLPIPVPRWLEEQSEQLVDVIFSNWQKTQQVLLKEYPDDAAVVEFHYEFLRSFVSDNLPLFRMYATALLAANVVHQHEKESV